MKKIITAFIFCFLCGECFSQAGEWVWIKGDSVPNQPGNFGVQGIPSPTNNPPALYEPCEWTDLNGNFWLFGGVGNGGCYNDLWKYDPFLNEWTWMKGSSILNDAGYFGIQGVPSLSNNPPARGFGSASWLDNQGNFWMFGGYGTANWSDLWKYNIATNEWTWVKGPNIANQPGNYGTQGIPDSANNPGSRSECAAAWTDNSGDLWLFGGVGGGFHNDLWRYNITYNQWTWMKGSQTQQLGIYGTQGIENTTNTPGSRYIHCRWKDINGKLWLFGGEVLGANVIYFNDLWRFNPLTNNWSWIKGSNTGDSTGIFGTKCISSATNLPRGSFENRAAWIDPHGNFWFFGGGKYYGSNTIVYNDLWKYCFATNQWIWESGDNTLNPPGHWGTFGISSPANKPNGRYGPIGWIGNINNLYLFGGSKSPFGAYNDLWRYTIDTTCGVCPVSTGIVENNLTNELLIFPNPTNSSFTLSFQSSSNQTIELRLYNTLGKQIYFSKEESLKGKFEKEINAEKWSDGIYFLQLKTKNGNINKRAIVNH